MRCRRRPSPIARRRNGRGRRQLSEDAGAEYRAETGQAGDQLAVGVLLEPLGHGGLRAVGVSAAVGEPAEHRRKWRQADAKEVRIRRMGALSALVEVYDVDCDSSC